MNDTAIPYSSRDDAAALRRALANGDAAYADPDTVYGIIDQVSSDPSGVMGAFGLKAGKGYNVSELSEPFRQSLTSAYVACLVRAASPVPVIMAEARQDAERMSETARLVAARTGVPEAAYADATDALLSGDPTGFDALMGEFYR